MYSFSFDDIARASWSSFKKNWKLLVPAEIATIAVFGLLGFVLARSASHWLPSVIAVFLGIYVVTLLVLGWTSLYLKTVRTGTGSWDDFRTPTSLWMKFPVAAAIYLGFGLLYTLVAAIPGAILVLIGYLTYTGILTIIGAYLAQWLIILALVYFGAKYQFLRYILIDHPELSPYQAFRRAAQVTKGSRLHLVGLILLMKLINLLGFVCVGLGLFVSTQVTALMQTRAYLFLRERAETSPVAADEAAMNDEAIVIEAVIE